MNKFFLSMLLAVICEVVTARRVRTLFDPSKMRTFEMPKSCSGMEFCFDDDNYPIDIVEELLKDATSLVVGAEDDVGMIGTYSDRQGDSSDEYDCQSLSRNDPIYYIVDEDGRDRVVVQMESRFQQRFSVMWCEQEGSMKTRTEHFLESMVLKYKMYCQNRYVNYDFLVLSMEPGYDGKWKMERARTKSGIPVCCTCRYDKY
ncbi:unnamed protein product [Arctia plantaginis]|uniref:Uncharacterized protein n=1 Tax=Arctia plantaginis TaxID=874455 RepID=A0A8S1A0Z7_ARCPL|nr:unnamed protein product [Arctia plantaginis]